jgi:hypothetical protein
VACRAAQENSIVYAVSEVRLQHGFFGYSELSLAGTSESVVPACSSCELRASAWYPFWRFLLPCEIVLLREALRNNVHPSARRLQGLGHDWPEHAEHAGRVTAAVAGLESRGLTRHARVTQLDYEPADRDTVKLVHAASLVDRLQGIVEQYVRTTRCAAARVCSFAARGSSQQPCGTRHRKSPARAQC